MMSSENSGMSIKQSNEGIPPVHRSRNTPTHLAMDSPQVYKTSTDFSDPPGVPVSPSIRTSGGMELHNRKALPSGTPHSVQLVDDKEQLLFDDHEELASELDCPVDQALKVVAIVGNTGDGKSYTLNQTFFHGEEIFATSASQTTCTMGVWAAYLANKNCLLLDTEGLLGTSLNQNQHRRLLLKVFALSDVVIYLTKAARLHTDMFTILADASDAFGKHFRPDLEALAKRAGLPWTAGQLGPAVIVFQETRHTDPLDGYKLKRPPNSSNPSEMSEVPLNSEKKGPAAKVLEGRLSDLNRNVDSFSSLHYVGTQTKDSVTDFKPLASLIRKLLMDNSVRAPRKLQHIFIGLQSLNARFATDIPAADQHTFVDEYFTCPVTCDSCSVRCCLGVGHDLNEQGHTASIPYPQAGAKPAPAVGCQYNPKLKNKVYYCKDCYAHGMKTMVVPKTGDSVLDAARYVCSGYVLECPRHGIIYQSRSLWSCNPEPEDTSKVHWEVVHVWSGEKTILQGLHPFSQILVDSLASVSRQFGGLAGPPVRLLSDLLVDSMAPEYWQPNSVIKNCAICGFEFPDPAKDGTDYMTQARQQKKVDLRDEGRTVKSAPKTSTERHNSDPTFVGQQKPRPTATATNPNSEASSPLKKDTPLCNSDSQDLCKHHCRACGRGVCAACSTGSLPVPGFGNGPVRVCDECYEKLKGRSSQGQPSLGSGAHSSEDPAAGNQVYTGRKALELCSATVGSVPPLFTRFKDTLKGFARPDYWTPDELCKTCSVCDSPFGPSRRIHHCRACGRGVCEPCSSHRKPVPLRGLEQPHRVCDSCFKSSSND
ncbi:unnamed protein product [Calicophoron daubneyi]|uniref:FYVE-type domain-containing protein n=1 Tax=Calicophoron daubneyi TaxID=300641 RepID=A0AAV2T0U8_CALDB